MGFTNEQAFGIIYMWRGRKANKRAEITVARWRGQNAEWRTQSAECRTQSAECRVQSAECRAQSAGCRPIGPPLWGGWHEVPGEGGRQFVYSSILAKRYCGNLIHR